MKRIIICVILVLSVLFGGCQNVDVQESSLEQSDTNIETDPAEQTSSEPNSDNSPTEGSLSSDTNVETDPAEQISSVPNSDNPLTGDPLPSQTIEIQGLEKLNEMRKMVACGDETQLGQYVQSVADSGIQSKDDLIAFVKLIDALPHISVLDGSVTWIRFSHSISEDTGKETNVVYVTTEATDGDWMRVEYVLSVTDVSKKILDEKIQVGEESLLRSAVTSADGKLTFHIEMRSPHPSGRGTMIQWVGEADGIFTRIFYYTDNERDVKTEELFGALEISDILQYLPKAPNEDTQETEPEEVGAGLFEEPPYYTGFLIDSYDELKGIFDPTNRDGLASIGKGEKKYGAVYQTVLEALAEGRVPLLIPHLSGKEIGLRDEVDLPRISVSTSELYNLPWIWYHCKLNGQHFRVHISYLDVLESPALKGCKTPLEVLSVIAPSAPSPSNFQKFSDYSSIYEKDIVLGDRTVTAMVSELKGNTREYVQFYMDGVLVILYGEKQLFTDEFLAAFTLEP